MRQFVCVLALSVPVLLLSACGGGDSDSGGMLGTGPVRGTLIQSPPARVASLSATQVQAAIATGDLAQTLLQLAATPKCGIDVHYLQYNTVGGVNEATTASGAMMIPTGIDAACRGARPIVLYAHGTTADRTYNIANFATTHDIEGVLLAAVFAAQGYIVVAPNYAGYDSSTLGYHPYLNADQSSKEMIDVLSAARSALPTTFAPTITDSGKLFITGYSQGGHVAMAAHRALQAAGKTVTASAPMSGPYALAAFGDAVFYGEVNLGAPLLSVLLITSYQHAYGNIYTNTTDVFEPQYASGIDSLLPSTTPTSTLYSQGKLPATQLFSSTPPDPVYASITPPTTPANFAPLFALGFGTGNLITNAFRLAYLNDAQMNPDGAWPTTTTGLPAAAPAHPARKAFKQNDLRNWAPTAPMLLCAGDQDPTVFYLNTQIMQGYWAMTAPTAPVTVLDVDSTVGSGDPYASLKNGFAAAKLVIAANAVAKGATDAGASAVLQGYHGTLVPPFCLAAAKSFFDAH